KHVAEAIVPMLAAVGIRAKLSTPEYSTYWPNIQRGRVPFYYMGRGSVTDPSPAIQQYFETGITPRIGYSNPEFDALLKAEREEFDDKKRRDILNRACAILQDDVPALFMWRHKLADGIASHVDF